MLGSTIRNYVDKVVTEPTIKQINYKIFWLRKKHCNQAEPVKQVDGKTAWRCTHYE